MVAQIFPMRCPFDEVQAAEGDLQEQHRVDHQPDQVRGGHGQQSAALPQRLVDREVGQLAEEERYAAGDGEVPVRDNQPRQQRTDHDGHQYHLAAEPHRVRSRKVNAKPANSTPEGAAIPGQTGTV
jgi:hypothetical protein